MTESGVLVSVQASTDVSAARRATLQAASAAGFSEDQSGAAAIVATEAASNLLKHAGSGEFLVRRTSGEDGRGLELTAMDRGPGMVNQERCFSDGYSTAGSAGQGLGAISRLSRFCDVYSVPGVGTVLVAQLGADPAAKTGFCTGALAIPYPGEDVCGDSCAVHQSPERVRIILADGLGHGTFAAQASQLAVRSLDDPHSVTPAQVLEAAHQRLKATRGSACSIADVDFSGCTVDFAGVGNVAGAVLESPSVRRQMISHNGTLGHEVRKIQQYRYALPKNSIVILHSDGLSNNWALEKYPGLFLHHPSVIAAVLFRDFRRSRDDASIVVLRERNKSR